MRVKSCVASDGGGHTIQLSDEFGCVLRPKMISRFLKARGSDDRATVITYAFFHAFKFPDALSVHIKCKVIMHDFQIELIITYLYICLSSFRLPSRHSL